MKKQAAFALECEFKSLSVLIKLENSFARDFREGKVDKGNEGLSVQVDARFQIYGEQVNKVRTGNPNSCRFFKGKSWDS